MINNKQLINMLLLYKIFKNYLILIFLKQNLFKEYKSQIGKININQKNPKIFIIYHQLIILKDIIYFSLIKDNIKHKKMIKILNMLLKKIVCIIYPHV